MWHWLLPKLHGTMHRIKIVGHCVPPRNAITRVMLSLGQGKGDQERREGGKLIFRYLHSSWCTISSPLLSCWMCTSWTSAVSFWRDILGRGELWCTLTVMETKLRPRCHLRSNLRALEVGGKKACHLDILAKPIKFARKLLLQLRNQLVNMRSIC